jgi:dethiobiotin synthetase
MWGWVVVEIANGILHPIAALAFQLYIAGVLTAPVLLVVALRLGSLLRQRSTVVS